MWILLELLKQKVFECQHLLRDILCRKAGIGDAIENERWSGDTPLEKADYLFVEPPTER
jgi:hypothetical protein